MGLSGGQQQRLCIARAIAVEPQVLLMDEPCSALDPISTSAIEDLIHELKTEYTIVIVTHNMQQAARVSRGHRLLQHRRRRQARQADRDEPHQEDLQRPRRARHRGLHLGPLRLRSSPGAGRASGRGVPRRTCECRACDCRVRVARVSPATFACSRRVDPATSRPQAGPIPEPPSTARPTARASGTAELVDCCRAWI